MIHLHSISLGGSLSAEAVPTDTFPFSLPVFQNLGTFELTKPVTILVGENGSGKSTLLEALAVAIQARTIGSQSVHRDPTLRHVYKIGRSLRLSWAKRIHEGFFLRAEDFFGFVKRIEQTKAGLQQEMDEVRREFDGRSAESLGLALSPMQKELGNMRRLYGDGLDTMSHGESFLALFQSRLRPNGLYLLDEPETPLSPLRQLTLISLVNQFVRENAQFIIATHSPILMAIPNANIFHIDEGKLTPTDWRNLEHVQLTRDFLNNPEQFLRHL